MSRDCTQFAALVMQKQDSQMDDWREEEDAFMGNWHTGPKFLSIHNLNQHIMELHHKIKAKIEKVLNHSPT